jgi:hypothetical protein
VLTDAFRNLSAWPVVVVERESQVLVKLRPIFREFAAKAVEDRNGQTTGVLVGLYH